MNAHLSDEQLSAGGRYRDEKKVWPKNVQYDKYVIIYCNTRLFAMLSWMMKGFSQSKAEAGPH